MGRLDDADATLGRLARDFPGSPTLSATRLRLAESALAAKKYDRAIELFRTSAEADDASKARARSGLGWSLLRAGKAAEAADAFKALLDDSPDDPLAPEAAVTRAYALNWAKQTDAAIEAYKAALQKYPDSPQAGAAALGVARLQVEAKKPAEAAESYGVAASFFGEKAGGPLEVILSEWGLGPDRRRQDRPVRLDLRPPAQGIPRQPQGRRRPIQPGPLRLHQPRLRPGPGPAQTPGRRGLDRPAGPVQARPSILLGRSQVERPDWPAASATFARLIAEDTEGTYRREARFWKAEVAFKSGDARAAEPEFAALAAEPPLEYDFPGLAPTALGRRVQCLAQLGRWDDTIAAADAYPADAPLAPEVDYARGRACQGLARFDDARTAFDRVIANRRGTELAARAQLMKGETYFHQQRYKDALPEYYRVILQYNAPEWKAVAYLEAGKVHEKLDQWKEAVESYEKLRAEFPNDRNADEAGKRLEAARAHLAGPKPDRTEDK